MSFRADVANGDRGATRFGAFMDSQLSWRKFNKFRGLVTRRDAYGNDVTEATIDDEPLVQVRSELSESTMNSVGLKEAFFCLFYFKKLILKF